MCEDVYEDGRIHPEKLNAVSRLGYSWYSDSSKGLFQIKRPAITCVGFDEIPEQIKSSNQLTAKELSQLANIAKRPKKIDKQLCNFDLNSLIHEIKEYLSKGLLDDAWVVINEIERRNS